MANRTDPERHAAQVRAANRARYRATRDLISENQERFDALYAKHAKREGVTPTPRNRIDAAALQDQINVLQERLSDLNKETSSA